jgi:hypothetical protein
MVLVCRFRWLRKRRAWHPAPEEAKGRKCQARCSKAK